MVSFLSFFILSPHGEAGWFIFTALSQTCPAPQLWEKSEWYCPTLSAVSLGLSLIQNKLFFLLLQFPLRLLWHLRLSVTPLKFLLEQSGELWLLIIWTNQFFMAELQSVSQLLSFCEKRFVGAVSHVVWNTFNTSAFWLLSLPCSKICFQSCLYLPIKICCF